MGNNLYMQSYKRLCAARTVFCALIMALMCIVGLMPSKAFADLYTVEGVEVDITAENALEAREQAFNAAQVKAYEMLSERLISNGETDVVPELDVGAISYMVQDFEVTKEQLSAKRYKGTYTIRFRPAAFQEQVINQGQSYSDIPRGAVLVLPFYQTSNRTVLWDPSNPFMSAWARAQSTGNVMSSTVVPIGDIEDVAQVNAFSPLNYDPVKFERLRDRYGANEVSIVLASPEVDLSGAESVRLSLYSAKIRGPQFAGQINVDGLAGETTQQLYDRVVAKLQQQYKSDWKQETAVATMNTQRLDAVMSFSSVREWIDAKQKLERVPGMASVDVNRLTPREASMALHYQGDAQRLAIALGQSGLMLGQAGNSYQPIYRIMRSDQQMLPQVQPQPQRQQQMQPYMQNPTKTPQVNAPSNQAPYGSSYNQSYYQ